MAIRNVIQRNGHFYLIDFGLATLLQLLSDPCQVIIQDYISLCQIIGVIKFEKNGGLKLFVATIENASRWKIINEEKWLEKFGVEVKQLHERDHHMSRKTLPDINISIILIFCKLHNYNLKAIVNYLINKTDQVIQCQF